MNEKTKTKKKDAAVYSTHDNTVNIVFFTSFTTTPPQYSLHSFMSTIDNSQVYTTIIEINV